MMRFPNATASTGTPGGFSDRVLSFELPRRGRRLQRAGHSHQMQRSASALRAGRGRSREVAKGQQPMLGAGSIADRFVQHFGPAFFAATASALFGEVPEVWEKRCVAAAIEISGDD